MTLLRSRLNKAVKPGIHTADTNAAWFLGLARIGAGHDNNGSRVVPALALASNMAVQPFGDERRSYSTLHSRWAATYLFHS